MWISIILLVIALQTLSLHYANNKRCKNIHHLIEMFRPQGVMKGHELIFLRRINKYGESSIEEVNTRVYKDDNFQITCLSMSQETYIAHGFSTFVVKIKKK